MIANQGRILTLSSENDQRREVRRVARHQEMMDKLEDQGRTIRNVNDITVCPERGSKGFDYY